MNANIARVELSVEEAERLLTLCLCSPGKLDRTAETAMRKLAAFIAIDRPDRDRPVLAATSSRGSMPEAG
ncbi:MAG: hypothetical protein MH204_07765 [Fimbriimonadaceae bacterium]|nr:hypothetical protein [Fimbriimonadaceae bacterium]